MTVKEKWFSSRCLTTVLLQHGEAVRHERPKAELLMGNDGVMHPADIQSMHYLPFFHGKYGHANPPQCYTIPAFSVLLLVTYKTPDLCCEKSFPIHMEASNCQTNWRPYIVLRATHMK
jgi:hypothetical protein